MKIRVDNIMIKKMNEFFGLNITYSDFKKFYIDIVKPARLEDPAYINKMRLNKEVMNDLINEFLKDDFVKKVDK